MSISSIKHTKVDNTPLKSIVRFNTDEDAWNFDRMLRSCDKLKGMICFGFRKEIRVPDRKGEKVYPPNCALYSLKDEIQNPWSYVTKILFPKPERPPKQVHSAPEAEPVRPRKQVHFSPEAESKSSKKFNPSNNPHVTYKWRVKKTD